MTTKTATKKFTPVSDYIQGARRIRRAYWGLHGLAFERAQLRWDQAREMTENLFEDCIAKGEIIEAKAEVTLKDAQAKLLGTYAEAGEKVRDILPLSGNRIEELEAEVATLNAKLKAVSKPARAKKPAAKKVPAKKTKAVEAVAAVVVETVEVADKYEAFIADVLRYDATADGEIVKKIVDHCGIALQSRDGQYVACSDETERQTVRESWLVKKLGLDGETADLDAAVMTVCETMQKDRMKNRVTFYYIAAKNAGKLDTL